MTDKPNDDLYKKKIELYIDEDIDINGTPKIGRVEISSLLGNSREIIFVHNGEEYRLRLTANNKLILTK